MTLITMILVAWSEQKPDWSGFRKRRREIEKEILDNFFKGAKRSE